MFSFKIVSPTPYNHSLHDYEIYPPTAGDVKQIKKVFWRYFLTGHFVKKLTSFSSYSLEIFI